MGKQATRGNAPCENRMFNLKRALELSRQLISIPILRESGKRIWSAAASGIPHDAALARAGRKAVPRPAHSAALVTALQVAFCTKQVWRGSQRKPMFAGFCTKTAHSTADYRFNAQRATRNVQVADKADGVFRARHALVPCALLVLGFWLAALGGGGDDLTDSRAAFPRSRHIPATPLEMALRLERELASGAGILMPDPERRVRLDGGVIALDAGQAGFPPEFLAGLVPEEINGVEAWRATLCADDLSGGMLFYNAAGEPFWSVAADPAVYTPDWIAKLHSVDGAVPDFSDTDRVYQDLLARPSRRMQVPDQVFYRSAWLSTRQYFLPSHTEMVFTFILREDLGAYRSGMAANRQGAALAGAPARSPTTLTGLTFTGIASGTNGVALSAAWPTNTVLAGGALDIFFTPSLSPISWTNPWRVSLDPDATGVELLIPRADLPPPPEAPAPACVTNTAPSNYDPGVTYTNTICTNAVWLADTGFFRLADLADTDGDGLTDANEKWVYGTSPTNPDTDGDGLYDGWEVTYGLDPLSPDDPAADPDGDGLNNLEESLLGTDPFNTDTDGDGLSDDTEAFAVIARDAGSSAAFDVSGGAALSALWTGWQLDYGVTNAALPFPVLAGGRAYSNLSVNANGLVGFYNAPGGSGLETGYNSGWDMDYEPINSGCSLLVAGFWDDLKLYPAQLGSTVTLADVTTNGTRYCVIEYRNAGFSGISPSTNNMVSFQIIFEEGVPDRVSVRFQTAQGRGDGARATLGAQTGTRTLQYAFREGGAVYAGLALTYLLGIGSNPLAKDTDGDGMPDGWEVSFGLDALNPADATPDLNGDGLSNLDNYLTGTDPIDTDFDKDGLTNADERFLGTGMHTSDTDGDGIPDGDEILVFGTDPLDPADGAADTDGDGIPDNVEADMGTDPGIHDSMADTDGDGLLDMLDPAPADPADPDQSPATFTIIHPAQGATLP